MNYAAINFTLSNYSAEASEVLIAMLDALNFEGIYEDGETVVAYTPANNFDENVLHSLNSGLATMACELSWEIKEIPHQNWNALWESNFEPVLIDSRCAIRAPFHDEFPHVNYQITIEPKMAFGTGHHQTTRLMAEQMLETEFQGKAVLDMGCGTGVLAILAAMRGAASCTAIDIDEWAYKNTLENAKANNIENISVIQGGKEKIPDQKFDLVLANINRNILLDQMQSYAQACSPKGLLLLSGILTADRDAISSAATQNGFSLLHAAELSNWLMLMFERI